MSRYDYDNWYVYELVDPRTDTTFYIGKTATPHGRFAAHKGDPASAAHARLTEIRLAGAGAEMRIIATFHSEDAALDYELYLIQRTPGLVNRMNYTSPTKPFKRPVTNVDEVTYVPDIEEGQDQVAIYERRVRRLYEVMGGDVAEGDIRRVLDTLEAISHEDGEYVAFTDE